MDAGKRNEPIYFETQNETNVLGEVTVTWEDAEGNSPPQPDWAYIISQKGQEALEAGRTNSTELIRLMVLYRADVQTTWRVKWNDQYYEILAVDRSQQSKNKLWITARLKGAQ